MDIAIHAMGMPFNGETIAKQSLGGSESAAYYQARELAARGHRVTIWNNTDKPGIWDGVTYQNVGNVNQQYPLGERFEYWARFTPHDVLIVQRHPLAFHKRFASKICIWQLHDLALYRTAGVANHGTWQMNFVTVVSDYHKKQVCEVYGFDPNFVKVVPNGVDQQLYLDASSDKADDLLGQKLADVFLQHDDKLLMLYQSRPERGLENLLKPGGIMEKLLISRPLAHLVYCGYENTVPQMRGYYAQLDAWAARLPNVTNLGALTKQQLAIVQKQCDLLVYPTTFKEVSCITAMEATHAGLPIMTSPVGALPETLQNAGVVFIGLNTDGTVCLEEYVNNIVHLNAAKLEKLAVDQRKASRTKNWGYAVDTLEQHIYKQFNTPKSPGSVARYAMEFSDISVLQPLGRGKEMGGDNIGDYVLGRERKLYEFTESIEKYKEHYAHHQGEYYDNFEDRVIGEDVTGSTRFKGVDSMMAQLLTRPDMRVLDYGCAHGHYIIPLAKRFPHVQFVGMDVSARAIAAAVKWAQQEGLDNVSFIVGTEDDISLDFLCPLSKPNVLDIQAMEAGQQPARKLFDAVLAGEVLEHVINYNELLQKFTGVLNVDGTLVITTPVGRWEWTGHTAFKTGREHLVHFDRQDVVEICNGNPSQILYAPASHDETGQTLGSWVWSVQPERNGLGRVDMKRKLYELMPRETVSACLIVRNGERTLKRCIESFIEYVDEVIIMIDPSTKDRTHEICAQIAKDYPLKPVIYEYGLEALKDGFDAARNRSIEGASGDWILWVDADEEIQQPWNLWQYLRPSMLPAVGFPQIHYSVAPAGVLTTDFPCRLFRNNRGIKFYGLVHEHPETAPGAAIKHATIRHDVQFLHCGYVDEKTRRERYHRNLPLVFKDVEKYPNRKLNNFLLLRDLAQGIVFEQEQVGGTLEDHPARAKRGIELFEKLLENEPVRMIVDAMKYYSVCVSVLGVGFDAYTSMKIAKEEAPDLKVDLTVEGRFYSRAHFQKLLTRLQEEATKHYESEYL